MNMKSQNKQALFEQKLLFSIGAFIDRFREHYVPADLVRIGGDADGGYLLPNIFKEIHYCFSPGVDTIATFEQQLSDQFGIKSFLADASVNQPPIDNEHFEFDKKFLGNRNDGEIITLSSWLEAKIPDHEKNLLLQMDIEGSEFDVLIETPDTILTRFKCMVIEFHDLQKVFDRYFLSTISSIFEKIYKSFVIVHVHPNNCCGIASYKGIEVPCVMEVTFMRKDMIKAVKHKNLISLPHALDKKNVEYNNDIMMPPRWWKG